MGRGGKNTARAAIIRARRRAQKMEQPENRHWSERAGWKTFFRIGEIAAFIAVIVGLIMLCFEFQDRKRERIARSWAILGTIATGNSGKREALKYLNEQNVPLTGIDLSCERMGGGWDPEERSCERPVYLRKVQLADADLSNANLQGAVLGWADLQGAVLGEADLRGADLYDADLRGANLGVADLQGAYLLEADLRGADLYDADLRGANLGVADLRGADLSRADFSDAEYLDKAVFTGAWAVEDDLPIGLSGIEIDICPEPEFDPSGRPIKPSSGCVPRIME